MDDVAGLAGWQLVSCGWRAGFYWIMPWARERCLRVRLGYKIDAAASTPTSAALSVLVNPWANFGRCIPNDCLKAKSPISNDGAFLAIIERYFLGVRPQLSQQLQRIQLFH